MQTSNLYNFICSQHDCRVTARCDVNRIFKFFFFVSLTLFLVLLFFFNVYLIICLSSPSTVSCFCWGEFFFYFFLFLYGIPNKFYRRREKKKSLTHVKSIKRKFFSLVSLLKVSLAHNAAEGWRKGNFPSYWWWFNIINLFHSILRKKKGFHSSFLYTFICSFSLSFPLLRYI